MLFYRFIGKLNGESVGIESNPRQSKRANAAGIKAKVETYSRNVCDGSFRFVSSVSGGEVICGAIGCDRLEIEKSAAEFYSALGLDAEYYSSDEITFRKAMDLLHFAEQEGYLSACSDALSRFGIKDLNWHDMRRIMFEENMILRDRNRETLYSTAKEALFDDTFSEELDRIFSENAPDEFYGHPVHYIIETDSENGSHKIKDALLSALYAQGRLLSQRYFEIDASNYNNLFQQAIKDIYEAGSGGAFVIKLVDELCDKGDELEIFGESAFDDLLINAAEYSNKVLFLFLLPKECASIKKRIAECLGELSFIEIIDKDADRARAITYLEAMAAKSKLPADEELFAQLEKDRLYASCELDKIFKRWYNARLKTAVYPQYKQFAECRIKQENEKSKGAAYDELASMIGLAEAKAVIEKALNFYKLQRVYEDRGIDRERPAMHMVFTGNPGTAKTTVARLFARIMKENDLLSRGHLVEVGRGDLVGRYVGWTAKTVEAKFREADGGVLFIDEAYSLVDDRDGSYGDEAINTIVQQMENRRDSMVVIFAGYPDKMEGFLDKNPGLRSRIAFHVPFDDYSAAELVDIAKHIGQGKGLKLSEGAAEKLEGVFEKARLSPDFGNGRCARNIIEKTEMNMAGRLLAIQPNVMIAEDLTLIMPEDIEVPAAKSEKREKRIGFGV